MAAILSLSLHSVLGADERQHDPKTPLVDIQSSLQVADGFTVEIAAAAPLVKYPMAACFDDRGRLFVVENAGVNQNADESEKTRPHKILLLVDRDGDGRFDTSTVFADRMTYPSGLAWIDGALFVTSAPYLWRFRDTDGDGVADERRQIFGRFNFIGIGNDLHGTTLGPDGRMYWVHGRGGGGHEIRDAKGNLLSKSRIAAIFSCWPDGTDLRKHCDGGMDNPVELAFFPEGQMIGSVNLLDMPIRNDALVHWMWGGVYPRDDVLAAIPDLKRTGDVLGGTVDFGHVAVSGVTRLRSDPQPDRWTLLVTEYNTHKVRRVEVSRSGSTYRGDLHELLKSTDERVYFTDVLEDADGSLLVINTGNWYSHCPEFRHADWNVVGGIYRLRRKNSEAPDDPRGLKIAWAAALDAELLPLLADDRFAVRDRAVTELSRRRDTAVAPLKRTLTTGSSVTVRRNAVWALCRMRTSAARDAVRHALNDADAGLREAAVHAVFANRDTEAVDALIGLLKDDALAVRREAATTIGILNGSQAVPALIEALASTPDRILEHALIYALIEIGDRQRTLAGLLHPVPDVRRGVLIALDQMDGGNLTRDQVAPLLDTGDFELQRTALQVIASHKGWAEQTIELLRGWLNERELAESRRQTLRGVLLAFSHDAGIQQLIANTLARHQTDVATRLLLLEVISRADLKQPPAEWHEQLLAHLKNKNQRVVRQTVVTMSASGRREYDEALRELSCDKDNAPELRAAAAAVVVQNGEPVANNLFQLLVGQCHGDAEPIERLSASRAIANSRLDRQQLLTLAGLLASAGPLELPVLTGAFQKTNDAQVGTKLLASLKVSPGRSSLSADRLKKLLQPFPPDVQQQAASLLDELNIDAGKQAARLVELRPALEVGDAKRGREIFFSKRTSCFACHRIGTDGGNVGPDLSAVGKIRSRRDLLESVVFPSATIVRGFEPVTLVTDAGRVHSGIIARETVDSIYLRTTDRREIRIARDEIDELAPSQISVMPQGLDKVISIDELRDLLAFLATLKPGGLQNTARVSNNQD